MLTWEREGQCWRRRRAGGMICGDALLPLFIRNNAAPRFTPPPLFALAVHRNQHSGCTRAITTTPRVRLARTGEVNAVTPVGQRGPRRPALRQCPPSPAAHSSVLRAIFAAVPPDAVERWTHLAALPLWTVHVTSSIESLRRRSGPVCSYNSHRPRSHTSSSSPSYLPISRKWASSTLSLYVPTLLHRISCSSSPLLARCSHRRQRSQTLRVCKGAPGPYSHPRSLHFSLNPLLSLPSP